MLKKKISYFLLCILLLLLFKDLILKRGQPSLNLAAFTFFAYIALFTRTPLANAMPLVIKRDANGRLLEPEALFMQVNLDIAKSGTVQEIDQWDQFGHSPLHMAARYGKLEELAELIQEGASVDIKDAEGLTPLMHAVSSEAGFPCVPLLLQAQADPNIIADGMTALDLSADTPDIVKVLHEAGGKSAKDITSEYLQEAREKRTIHLYLDMIEESLVEQVLSSPDPEAEADKSLRVSIILQRPCSKLEELIQRGADVNQIDGMYGEPPLITAIKHRQNDAVQLLLSYGASPDAQDSGGVSALHIACGLNPEMALVLLDAGASAKGTAHGGYTPLHAAAVAGQDKLIQPLFKSGADVNAQDLQSGLTPLHMAGNAATLRALLACNADASILDGDGNDVYQSISFAERETDPFLLPELLRAGLPHEASYLAGALSQGDTHVFYAALEALQKKGKLPERISYSRMPGKDLYSPLRLALITGNPDFTRALLQAGADPNNSMCEPGDGFITISGEKIKCSEDILARALDSGHKEMAHVLIAGNADVNAPMNAPDRETPLHIAARTKDTASLELILSVPGVIIDPYSVGGETPLYMAAEKNFTDGIIMLLQSGANPNAEAERESYRQRNTPFLQVLGKGNIQAVQAFIQYGADVYEKKPSMISKILARDTTSQKSILPIFYAAGGGNHNEVMLLLQAGASVTSLDPEGHDLFFWAADKGNIALFELLLEHGLDVHSTPHKASPLHIAAKSGNITAMEFFLQSGIKVNSTDEDGASPLFWAASSLQVEATTWLLTHEANPVLVNNERQTALHALAGYSHSLTAETQGSLTESEKHICDILLQAGIPIDSKDIHGNTPLHIAARSGNSELVRLLVSNGADLEVRNKIGDTPLLQADPKSVGALLQAGAEVNALDSSGKTPYDRLYYDEIREQLCQHGGKPSKEL